MSKLLNAVKMPSLNGPYKPYLTLADDTELTVGPLRGDKDFPTFEVYIERPASDDFDTLRIDLPYLEVIYSKGFSDKEISEYKKFLCKNQDAIYHIASGGNDNA